MLIPRESRGLKGAELDKATELARIWRWEWGMVGEADKKRGGERQRRESMWKEGSWAMFSLLLHSDTHIVANIHPLSIDMNAISFFFSPPLACIWYLVVIRFHKKKSSTHSHSGTECITRQQKWTKTAVTSGFNLVLGLSCAPSLRPCTLRIRTGIDLILRDINVTASCVSLNL